MNETLKYNFEKIQQRVSAALKKAGRTQDSLRTIAVSKGQTAAAICELNKIGQSLFGENYVQEWKEKRQAIQEANPLATIEWHFIGRLQTNKVKEVVGHTTLIHSVDRLELALKLESEAQKKGVRCNALLEIDLAHEPTKTGFKPETLRDFFAHANTFENLQLSGFMLMPPPAENPEQSRPYFAELKKLLKETNQQNFYKSPLTELSMGMTDDYWIAIEEGATLVRIGRAFFNPTPQETHS